MSRPLQFSLRTILAIMAAVAVGCAIWVKLPLAARLAIGAAALGMLIWAMEWLMPDHRGLFDWVVRGDSNQKHVIRRDGSIDEHNRQP